MPARRRFALVCPNFYPRVCGVGDHSMRMAEEMIRRGDEAAIFTRGPAQPNPEAPALPVFAAEGPTPMVVAEKLRRQLRAFAPSDLVLQYTPQMWDAWRLGSPATLWLATWARAAGVRVVLVGHELFLPWRRRADLFAGAVALRAQLLALMKVAHRTIVTMQMRIDEVAWMTRLLGQAAPGLLRVGSNALPVPARRQPGRLRLGVFSTMASTKRFDIVLDAFTAVLARRPEAELVVLGNLGKEGDPRVKAFLDDIARSPGAARVRVTGRLDLEQVAQEVADLDIYLFPMISGANTRSGTLPLALGAGVPVVATHGYETDDVFVDGENVAFAGALSGAAFAETALRIAGDPALAARLVAGGRRLYDEHLAWGRIVDRLYEEVA